MSLSPIDTDASTSGDAAPVPAGLVSIGVLRTPWKRLDDCPRNGRQLREAPLCSAVLKSEYVDGLQDLEGFNHLILLYWLHAARGGSMRIIPRFDSQERGVFATRAPWRPNPIGLSVVRFEGYAAPGTLSLRYLDCLDGTALLDIKPYLRTTDAVDDATLGWLAPHVGSL